MWGKAKAKAKATAAATATEANMSTAGSTDNQALSNLKGALGIAGTVPSFELIRRAVTTIMLPRGRPE